MQFIEKKSALFILLAIPFVLYAKSLLFGFSPMDEQWMIVHDADFLEKWKNIVTVFKEPTAEIFYRPLFMITLIVDYHIGELSPIIYHFSNLVFHLACVYFLFVLLIRLNTARKTAWILSLIFAVHPALVHAVAWVPGRNDVLLCLLTLLSLLQLLQFLNNRGTLHFVLHLLFFSAALLVKETAVALPLVYALLLWMKNADRQRLLLPIFLWLSILVLWAFIYLRILPFHLSTGTNITASLGNFFLSLLVSLGKLVVPVKQSVLPTLKNEPWWPGVLALLLLGFIVFKYKLRNPRFAIFGGVACLALLVIPSWYGATSGLGEHYDHRLYTPAIGLVLFLSQVKLYANPRVLVSVFSVVFFLLAAKTFFRLDVYKDEESYLDAGIKDAPHYYLFHFKKGNILLARNEHEKAIESFSHALELNTSKPEIFNNRGNAYVASGKKEQAIEDYNAALQKSNNDPRVLLQRCRAYSRFDDVENAMKDLEILKQCCSELVDPEFEMRLTKRWRFKIIEALSEEIARNPTNGLLYVNRAKYYLDNRMGKEALADLEHALRLKPDNKDFRRYYEELSATFPR